MEYMIEIAVRVQPVRLSSFYNAVNTALVSIPPGVFLKEKTPPHYEGLDAALGKVVAQFHLTVQKDVRRVCLLVSQMRLRLS